jgi:hypothetical protein
VLHYISDGSQSVREKGTLMTEAERNLNPRWLQMPINTPLAGKIGAQFMDAHTARRLYNHQQNN